MIQLIVEETKMLKNYNTLKVMKSIRLSRIKNHIRTISNFKFLVFPRILTFLVFTLLLVFASLKINAQCACSATDYGSIDVAGMTVGQTLTITGCQDGGERSTINNTVVGGVYLVSSCGASFDSQLSIYTTGCTYVAYNDDGGPGCGGTAASVQFTSPGGSLYAVFNQYSCAVNTDYCNTITITYVTAPRSCGTCTPADASLGSIGTTIYGYSVSGNCGNGGSYVASFTGEAGAIYHFDLCPGSPGTGSITTNWDPDIKITDASCGIITGIDGSCTGGLSSWQPNDFTWTCPSAGTYNVVIAPFSSYSSHTCSGTAANAFTLNYYKQNPCVAPTISIPATAANAGVTNINADGYITTGKKNCWYYTGNPTTNPQTPYPDIADMGMSENSGYRLEIPSHYGAYPTSGLTYSYTFSPTSTCGTYYVLDMSTLNSSATPAIGVSCSKSGNSNPYLSTGTTISTTPSGVGTSTLTFPGTTQTTYYNSSGTTTTSTINTQVIVTASSGSWVRNGNLIYLPVTGSFTVNVRAEADASGWTGFMTGSNTEQLGCPYQSCNEVYATSGWYGINYLFNSRHSLNNNYVNHVTWGTVYESFNPTWTVDPPSVGGTVSGGTTICAGNASGSLSLSGQTGTVVRWESSVSPYSSWTPISNTATTYTSSVLTQTTQFRAVVQNSSCPVAYSNATTVTVDAIPVAASSISLSSTSLCSGSSLTVTRNGAITGTDHWWMSRDGAQWDEFGDGYAGSSSWTRTMTCPGSNASYSYYVLNHPYNGACGWHDWDHGVYSATVTVYNSTIAGSLSGGGNTICLGSSTGTISLSGQRGSIIKWQKRLNGGSWLDISNTSSTYSEIPSSAGTWEYVAVVQNGPCSMLSTTSVTVIVNQTSDAGTFTQSPASGSTVCPGTTITYTQSGGTGTFQRIEYQWNGTAGAWSLYSNSNGATWGATPGVLYMRAIVKNGVCAEVASSPVVVTVNPTLTPSVSIALTTGSNPMCAGATATFTASPTNGGTTPSYQWKVAGVDAGTNSPIFTTTGLTNGQIVTCVMTSNATCVSPTTATSTGITMTVNPVLTPSVSIALTTGSNPMCAG
ncbi:MAG: hypothetical protein WCP69_15440, partial [Bacteroidota bacterium]